MISMDIYGMDTYIYPFIHQYCCNNFKDRYVLDDILCTRWYISGYVMIQSNTHNHGYPQKMVVASML